MTPGPLTGRRRFFKLAGLSASVAGRYAHSRVKAAFSTGDRAAELRVLNHQHTGRKIAETLGELKGAVMKVGQMASEVRGYYPVEPYKGKGVRYAGEDYIRKVGKQVQ